MKMDGIWVTCMTGKSNPYRFSFSYLTFVLSCFVDLFVVGGFRYIYFCFYSLFDRETLLSCGLFAVSSFNEKSIIGVFYSKLLFFVFLVFVCFLEQLGARQCGASGFGWQVTVNAIPWPQVKEGEPPTTECFIFRSRKGHLCLSLAFPNC